MQKQNIVHHDLDASLQSSVEIEHVGWGMRLKQFFSHRKKNVSNVDNVNKDASIILPHGPRIGLALGSGGARGWAHLGVIKRLTELGITPVCVSGTSIGALVGAVYAKGNFEQLLSFATSFDWRHMAQFFMEFNLSRSGLLEGRQIHALLADPQYIGDATFEELNIPFFAVATDLDREKMVLLHEGSVIDAVRASLSIPGIFTPIQINNQWLVDGGLSSPLPIQICRDAGADIVIAVDVNLNKKDVPIFSPTSPSLFDVLTQSIRIFENQITRRQLLSSPPDVLIQPQVGHVSTLDFRNGDAVIQAGVDAVNALIPELQKVIPYVKL